MPRRRDELGTVAVMLVVGGLYTVAAPPGMFWFAAGDCGPTGDCANTAVPAALGAVSLLAGLLGGGYLLVQSRRA